MKVFEHFCETAHQVKEKRRGKRLETQIKYIILVKIRVHNVRAVNNGLIEVKRHTVALFVTSYMHFRFNGHKVEVRRKRYC